MEISPSRKPTPEPSCRFVVVFVVPRSWSRKTCPSRSLKQRNPPMPPSRRDRIGTFHPPCCRQMRPKGVSFWRFSECFKSCPLKECPFLFPVPHKKWNEKATGAQQKTGKGLKKRTFFVADLCQRPVGGMLGGGLFRRGAHGVGPKVGQGWGRDGKKWILEDYARNIRFVINMVTH